MATAMASTGQNSFIARNWRDLIRPRNLEVDVESLTPTYGKFTCEPLERGFGTTLGNSLRRILLSSLQGAAITAVKIEGALHEFTTIPDVVEDVTDIVLNLKEVLLKAVDSKPRVLRIEKDGEGRVNAGDIHLTRRDRGPQPGPQDPDLLEGRQAAHGADRRLGPRLRPLGAQQGRAGSGRRHPDRLALLADPQGELPGHQRPRRAADRLRSSEPRGLDQRRRQAGRRGGLRRQDPQGPALHLHQLRRGERSRPTTRTSPRSRQSSTRTSGSRSTSWSCRSARRTASRTPTSATSASWFSAPSPRC